MLVETLFPLSLAQTPAAPASVAVSPPDAPAQQAAASQPTTARQTRLDAQRRHNGALVCETRAPTGSIMNRQVCRRERQARSDAARARAYVSEVTRGSVNEPNPDIGSQ